MRPVILLVASCCACAYGQHFEVASVKAVGPPDRSIPREPRDPGLYTRRNFPLVGYIDQAYRLRGYNRVAPSWTFTTYFDLEAKLPDGASMDQIPAMLQNLLAERFGLKVHWEDREMTVYDLVIGKGGPQFKEAKEGEPPPAAPPNMSRAEDGYLPPEGGMMWVGGMGALRKQITMEALARQLDGLVRKPVHDETGLKGKYNLSLHWSGPVDSGDTAPGQPDFAAGLFGALQSQLGLKIEAKKAPVPVLVVDHCEKMPTEN